MEKELAILIPILVPLGFFAMLFGIVYLQKRENLAMIDKGMNPKNQLVEKQSQRFRNLKWGLLLVGAGVGLILANIIDSMVTPVAQRPDGLIYFAMVAIGGGTGLIISYRIEEKGVKDKESKTVNSPEEPVEL